MDDHLQGVQMQQQMGPIMDPAVMQTTQEGGAVMAPLMMEQMCPEPIHASRTAAKVILPSRPHTNGTKGHWETILREVEAMKQSGEYRTIYVNKALSNEIPGAHPNRRPDVMGVRPSRLIDQVEVPSKTDNPKALIDRMKDNQRIMGERAGSIKVRDIDGDQYG